MINKIIEKYWQGKRYLDSKARTYSPSLTSINGRPVTPFTTLPTKEIYFSLKKSQPGLISIFASYSLKTVTKALSKRITEQPQFIFRK